MIQNFFLKRKIKKLIIQATEIIYSGQSEITSFIEKNFISNKSGRDLIYSYVAAKIASELIVPVDKLDIEQALQKINSFNLRAKTSSNFDDEKFCKTFIELLKAETYYVLAKREFELAIDKKRYDQDKYSLKGMIYIMKISLKRPLTIKEQEFVKSSYEKIQRSNDVVENLKKEIN
jgi:hypothetical protein